MLMEDMTKEDIEKCGKDIKLFNEIIDLEGYNYVNTFKWLCMLRRVVKRLGWTAGYSLKLGNLYMAAALSRSVPMEEIREVTKHAHEADVDAHMTHVVAVVLIEAVQAILKDETARDDRMHDMGNGMAVKISEGVVLDRDEDDQELTEEQHAKRLGRSRKAKTKKAAAAADMKAA